MTARGAALTTSAVAAAAVVVVLLTGGGASTRSASETPGPPHLAVDANHPEGVMVGCSRRSEANFPGAYADSHNLVAGPLVLVGGAYTPASVVREFGGNKFPLLVKAGHRVTLRLPAHRRGFAGLAY